MASLSRISSLLILVTSCGFPRPPDVSDPSDSGLSIHVSPAGDDANDGFTQPVKTLKHAIGIAASNDQVTTIILAGGRYATESGETFPYTVPANVTIVGPAGGGAILAGTKVEPGMIVAEGTLQDLELESFTVAIIATGLAHITNVHVRTAMIAVRAETAAKLMVDNLDITGTVAACATGIVLNGAADLAATALATRNLGTTLDARDQSTINLAKVNITGDPGCAQTVMVVGTNKSFTLSDSLVDGGRDGISLLPAPSSSQATISNTILRNLKKDALGGSSGVTFVMTGGELSNNGQGGAEIYGGSWTFSNVLIKQNPAFGVYLESAALMMRRCSIVGNGNGIYLLAPISVDLGTVASDGNNILQNNSGEGLYYDSSVIQVEAVGNTWNPGVQGADNSGRYVTPAVLQGPINPVSYSNYSMSCDPGQCTLHR